MSQNRCRLRGVQTVTYEPSGRRDSGMTRSSVRGSTTMPAVVALGLISGFDIVKFYDK